MSTIKLPSLEVNLNERRVWKLRRQIQDLNIVIQNLVRRKSELMGLVYHLEGDRLPEMCGTCQHFDKRRRPNCCDKFPEGTSDPHDFACELFKDRKSFSQQGANSCNR